MPYIPKDRRLDINIGADNPRTVGELTYVLYKAAVMYLRRSEGKFATHAEVVAALECAKAEFQRRYLAPYEDQKIAENGDV